MSFFSQKKYLALTLGLIIFSLTSFYFLPLQLVLGQSALNKTIESLDKTAVKGGLNTQGTITAQIANIISFVLGFMGVIFLILIIYAGFQWMTAGGNSEQVKKSQGMMTNAAIGLALILASYLITNFFFFQFQGVPSATGF